MNKMLKLTLSLTKLQEKELKNWTKQMEWSSKLKLNWKT
jgi:hypothetical protein